jgi:hypothetical protein
VGHTNTPLTASLTLGPDKLPRASVRRSLVLGLGAGGAVGLLETLRSRVARAREEAEREETR